MLTLVASVVLLAVPVLAWLAVAGVGLYHLFRGHHRAFSGLTIAAATGLTGLLLRTLMGFIGDLVPIEQFIWVMYVVSGIQQVLGGIGLVGILVALMHRGAVEESEVG